MIIYLAVNRRTGLKYVGATKATLWKRQIEHRSKASRGKATRFHTAIREHGWGSFKWHVLSKCETTEELLAEERRWIVAFDTQNPALGYNMTKGGCGVIGYEFSVEARQKIALAGTGRIKTDEERRKLSIANKGKKPSEAAINGVRARVWTEEQRQRLREAKTGKRLTLTADGLRKRREANQRRKENDKNSRIPHSHLSQIRERRANGESFASIGRSYDVEAPHLFVWLKNRRASL